LDVGLSAKKGILTLYGICSVVAVLSLLTRELRYLFSPLIVRFGGAAWFGVRQLHRSQFELTSSMFLGRQFRRIIDAESRTADLEASLTKAISMEDCWAQICKVSQEFGFHEVRMSLCGQQFEAACSGPAKPRWQLRIPLPDSQWVNFYRDFDSNVNPLLLNAFVEAVQRGLEARSGAQSAELTRVPALDPSRHEIAASIPDEVKRMAR
jgi:hypothetical protein